MPGTNERDDEQIRATVAAVADPIGSAGAAFYFDPATLAKGKELGLDGFRFYALGRGGVLGSASAQVVQSAFGFFHIDIVSKLWDSARTKVEPAVAATAYLECNAALGRTKLQEVDGLEAFCHAAEKVIAKAIPDSLPLFAGMISQPVPQDLPARAIHNVAVLRELRGSVHLLAVMASNLDPGVAHAIRRPNDTATFGYVEPPAVSSRDRDALAEADSLTNRLLLKPYSALDAEASAALVDGVNAIHGALG